VSDFSEFHEVVPEVEKRLQTIFAIAWDVDSEAFLTKPFFQVGRCLALVLNDGEFHSIPVYLELAGGLSVLLDHTSISTNHDALSTGVSQTQLVFDGLVLCDLVTSKNSTSMI